MLTPAGAVPDDVSISDTPPVLALEIAIALAEHIRARTEAAANAKRNGRAVAPLPLGFVEVRDRYAAVARSGQQTTDAGPWADLVESGFMAPRLLTREQVACALNCSVKSVDRYIADGDLLAVQPAANTVRVRTEDLENYIAHLPTRSVSTKDIA